MKPAKRVPPLGTRRARHLRDQKIIAQLRRENSMLRATVAGALAEARNLVHGLSAPNVLQGDATPRSGIEIFVDARDADRLRKAIALQGPRLRAALEAAARESLKPNPKRKL